MDIDYPKSMRRVQRMFESIYGARNRRLYTDDEILLHVVEQAGEIAEILRKYRHKSKKVGIEPAVARFFGWLVAFCNHKGIDLESAVFSKYHGCCPYCGNNQHCSCIAAETKPRVWRKNPEARRPLSLWGWQEQFEKIYGRVNTLQGLLDCAFHVYEELGEVSKAHRLGQKTNLNHEIADLFAWLISVCNHLELNLHEVVLHSYPERCDVCNRPKCRCPKV